MKDVCIIGLGPAGFGALNTFAQSAISSNIVAIEAGVNSCERHCQLAKQQICANETPCEIVSGVGGCSCTTGAKLSGYPAGSGLVQILGTAEEANDKLNAALLTLRSFLPIEENKKVQQTNHFKELGFEYRHYPVYHFDPLDLAKAYHKILSHAESKGATILLKTRVVDITRVCDHYKLLLLQGTKYFELEVDHLIIAVGSEGHELIEKLDSQLKLSKKEYHLDVGVRLEFPSALFSDIDKYHGDLKLIYKNARTFCICKGGCITPYRYHNIFALEGSLEKNVDTGFTNFAIIVRQKPSPDNIKIFTNIISNVRRESGGLPVNQTLTEYVDQHDFTKNDNLKVESTIKLRRPGNIDNCFPFPVANELKEAVRYFALQLLPLRNWNQVNVFAPELDFRLIFQIQKDFLVAPKLYMAGECTGRFRGILQAFCSGEICANNLLDKLSGDKKE